MKPVRMLLLAPLVLAAAACKEPVARTEAEAAPVKVRVAIVDKAANVRPRFTGVVHARTESNLGFRVGGKIAERLVDPGDRVRKGQPLMRLDPVDFSLAENSARADVAAARAQQVRTAADAERSTKLVADGWTSKQTYDQNRAAADAALAQLAAAEAKARQIANQSAYTELQADSDGVILDVPAEPGQVVATGQTVVRLARDGAREAEINIPEGALADASRDATASLYANRTVSYPARLRELSAVADPTTRTYRARYVLAGGGEGAPIGATVTVQLTPAGTNDGTVSVPVGALRWEAGRSSVWVVDPAASTVSARTVGVARLGEETADIASGLAPGDRVVALGAHLLKEGQTVSVGQPSYAEARR